MAESFSQVPFHYQIANHDHENATFIRYNELVSNYERSKGTLTETQHAELIQILVNASHLCYHALKAITVCSGLDGQCCLNNEICDLKILFHSYEDECQSISLPMRANRKTNIEILFSRDTVNKYDFWSLTP